MAPLFGVVLILKVRNSDGHFDIDWGERKYCREERHLLPKIHKYFLTLWSSIIGGGGRR